MRLARGRKRQEELDMDRSRSVAVVIPAYKVRDQIIDVIDGIGPEVDKIYVVDDACPDGSGRIVEEECPDKRVVVIRNASNRGVGGAVIAGYEAAIYDGIEIIVKVDGDGQMDPALIPDFISPISNGEADYVKGNRFFDVESVRNMPRIRLIGNAVLSFMSKISTGYWDLFDPTNGYTAIHSNVAKHIPFEKVSERYFFETDMLFRLNTLRAVVVDVPMNACYGGEVSNLKIRKIIVEFLIKHARNFIKRIFYNYYLRGMSVASIELPLGVFMLIFGVLFGAHHWAYSGTVGVETPAGTVMLSALPIIVGLQFVLAFLSHDVNAVPNRPIQSCKRSLHKATFSKDFEAK